jgi:hypothetical protein
MLKKIAFVAAMLLMVGSSYAGVTKPDGYLLTGIDWETNGTYSETKAEPWNWPAEYKWQAILAIPVKLDVGYWIRIDKATDLTMKVRQVSIHEYAGKIENVQVTTNVNIELSAEYVMDKNSDGSAKFDFGGDFWWEAPITPSTLDAPGGKITIELKFHGVSLKNLTPNKDCYKVGVLILKVRPNLAPALAGGC